MAINYKTYVEKYPSGYSIRVTFGNENRLIDISQDTMSNKTKAITYAKNLAKQNKGIYAGFKEMGQLSLFSNTKKKNTMAVKKTKAVTAAKTRVKKASTALKTAKKKVTAAKKKVTAVKKTYVKLVQTKVPKANVARDSKRKALKPGKRVSASGKTYYEYRQNRTDLALSNVCLCTTILCFSNNLLPVLSHFTMINSK